LDSSWRKKKCHIRNRFLKTEGKKKKTFKTVRPCKPLKVMYVRGVQTCFGAFWGKKSYRDVR
jgi:hypothetical protein